MSENPILAGGASPASIRVAVLTGSTSRFAGGLFVAVRRPAMEVAKLGVNIEVFAPKERNVPNDQGAWLPVKVNLLPRIGPRSFGFCPFLSRAVRAFNPDVVHVHGLWMYKSLVNKRLWLRRRCPYVITIHGQLDPEALAVSRVRKRLAWRLFEGGHLKNASCIHVFSPNEAQVVTRMGIRRPICIIPNGVDLPARGKDFEIPWRGRLKPGEKALLFLGRIAPQKGLDRLLRVLGAIRRERPQALFKWRLVIAGWDHRGHLASVRDLVRVLNLDDFVVFLGPLFGDDKEAVLQWASAFVYPSYFEGMPVSVLEAWGHGLPSIIFASCNFPRQLTSGAALEASTEEELGNAIIRMCELSDEERRCMGAKAQGLVAEHFSWERIGGAILDVYRKVIAAREPARDSVLESGSV